MTATTAVLTVAAGAAVALTGAHYLAAELDERDLDDHRRRRLCLVVAVVVPLLLSLPTFAAGVGPDLALALDLVAVIVGVRAALTVDGRR